MLLGRDFNVSIRKNTCFMEEKRVGLPQQEGRRSFESRQITHREEKPRA